MYDNPELITFIQNTTHTLFLNIINILTAPYHPEDEFDQIHKLLEHNLCLELVFFAQQFIEEFCFVYKEFILHEFFGCNFCDNFLDGKCHYCGFMGYQNEGDTFMFGIINFLSKR